MIYKQKVSKAGFFENSRATQLVFKSVDKKTILDRINEVQKDKSSFSWLQVANLSLGLGSKQRRTYHGNLKREKNEIMAQYARHEGDTGSVEVQVAVLTWEINHLNDHIKQHKKTTQLTVV